MRLGSSSTGNSRRTRPLTSQITYLAILVIIQLSVLEVLRPVIQSAELSALLKCRKKASTGSKNGGNKRRAQKNDKLLSKRTSRVSIYWLSARVFTRNQLQILVWEWSIAIDAEEGERKCS
jgi:hypothetical protein